jgi:hypothetical protein
VAVRFFVDADLLGLAKLLVTVRTDVTYPGDPGGVGIDGRFRSGCPVRPSDKDADWIPAVAAEGWVVITRDGRLRHRPLERRALLETASRIVLLESRDSLNKWGQLEIVVPWWRKFEELAGLPGPWLYVATRSGIRRETLVP